MRDSLKNKCSEIGDEIVFDGTPEFPNHNVKQIAQRSGQLQDILGQIPHWTQRIGVYIITVFFLLIVSLTFFLKDPDLVSAEATLTGQIPTSIVLAKTNGKITEIYVNNNQFVKSGTYLGVLENNASTQEVSDLKTLLDSIIQKPERAKNINFPYMRLGDLQGSFNEFNRSVNNYKNFHLQSYYPSKIHFIQERIEQTQLKLKELNLQKELMTEQHALAKNAFVRDSLLMIKQSISLVDYENSYKEYLQNQLSLENLKTTYNNLVLEVSQLNESLLDIKKQYTDNIIDLENELLLSGNQFLNEIKGWETNYVLVAPIDGYVTLTKYWSINQNVSVNDGVFYIVPEESENLLVKAKLPIERSGKVKIGQDVNIYFSNFPYEEFGLVRGKVKDISLVPSDGNYMVEMSLPDGLKTTYNKELPYTQDMEGNAEIITDNILLIERFFNPIKGVINKKIN